MDVNIGEMVSTIRAVDSDTLLAPQTLAKIVQVVLQAVEEREAHRSRVCEEQCIHNRVAGELLPHFH
jgi:hypothetical protein